MNRPMASDAALPIVGYPNIILKELVMCNEWFGNYKLLKRVFFVFFLCLSLMIFSGSAGAMDNMTVTTQQVVPSGQTLTLSGRSINFSAELSANPAFLVQSGATLRMDGCFIDLSGIGNKMLIRVESGGTLILDSTEITGASNNVVETYIAVNGGTISLQNGTKIHNNINTLSGERSIIKVVEGSINIDNAELSNNRFLSTYHDNNSFSSVIRTDHSNGTIRKAVFASNLTDSDGSLYITGSELFEIYDSTFSNNESMTAVLTHGGGAVTSFSSSLLIGSGTVITRNRAGEGGALRVHQSDLTIEDNVTFSENFSTDIGGAIYATNSNIFIGASLFEKNGNNPDLDYPVSQYGGAIAHRGGKLELNGTVFIKNKSNTFGGAIEATFTHPSFQPLIPAEVKINNAVFEENYAAFWGGALCIGMPYRGYDKNNYETTVSVHQVEFKNNESGEMGGAVFVDELGRFFAKKLAIVDNHAKSYGGGVYLAEAGSLFFRQRSGVLIQKNTSDTVPGDYLDISDGIDGTLWHRSGKFFNGERAALTSIDPGGLMLSYYFIPVPFDTESASVLMTGNEANLGGAMAVIAGIADIGEDSRTLRIDVEWDDNGNEAGKRPSPEKYPEYLRFFTGSTEYKPGIPILAEKDEESGTYAFDYSDDSFLTCELNFDPEKQTYSAKIFGLPQPEMDPSENYTVRQELRNYVPEYIYSEDTSSIRIVNRFVLEDIFFVLRVIWEDEGNILRKRPDPESWLRNLILLNGETVLETGKLLYAEKDPDDEGQAQSRFTWENIPYASILLEAEENEYHVSFIDMPQKEGDQKINYAFSDDVPGYEFELSGNLTDGFTIIHRLIDEPEPEHAGPDMHWYRIGELQILPQTGFPTDPEAQNQQDPE